jgi:hypothetical protein
MSATERIMAALPTKEWLTSKEVAAAIGKTHVLLHEWRKRKTGPPYFRMCGRVFYRREEFAEWLRASYWG